VDAATGRRVWHYQIVRHGVWDYDLPAAPNLADVTVNGRRVKAVAQVTKQGFVFVFDRVTGRPLVAIDLNSGEHAWTVPLGEGPRKHPHLAALDLPRLGSPRRGFPLVTRMLLFAAQEGHITAVRWAKDRPWVRIFTWANVEPTLEVFDKTTGALLARIELPANAQGALMTYMVRGKQYIVVPVGGANLPAELVALSLP